MKNQLKNQSKFLSLLLRHKPETVDLTLDAQGWANVSVLLEKINATNRSLTFTQLERIVTENDKKRFVFNTDKTKIRAAQGHSLQVELGYKGVVPPAVLYHGTIAPTAKLIKNSGIKKMQRHHVHLSADIPTAEVVAARRGKPVILQVRARAMHASGYAFYQSDNGVWLTDFVPAEYVDFSDY